MAEYTHAQKALQHAGSNDTVAVVHAILEVAAQLERIADGVTYIVDQEKRFQDGES